MKQIQINFNYLFRAKHVMLLAFFYLGMFNTFGQTIIVKGTVSDTNNSPLPGVAIIVKGNEKNGTESDFDGNFSIQIEKPETTLIFLYLGYKSQEVVVDSQTTINVVLAEDTHSLDEIVLVGYGSQKRGNVTGAISTVNVGDMQKITTSNASVALQGKVSGVNIVQSNANPGAGADIRIRGIGTLGNHYPLIIIDGVPTDQNGMNSIDSNDIESLSVLKDAASAAIYGSRAANGVIIIKTKRGAGVKDKTQVNYRSYLSSAGKEKEFGLIDNASDYIKVVKQAADNSGDTYPSFVSAWESNPSQFGNTNWEDALFRNAFTSKHELSVARQGDDYNFIISAASKDQKGIRMSSGDVQNTLRINSDFKIGKRIKIGESFGYTTNTGQQNFQSHFFFNLVAMSPLHKIYDGTTQSGYGSGLNEYGFKEATNLIRAYEMDENNYERQNILLSAYAEIEFIDNLKYTFRISQNEYRNTVNKFSPSYYTDNINFAPVNSGSQSIGINKHKVLSNILSYNLETGNHNIDAMIGFSREEREVNWSYGSGQNSPSNGIRNLGGFTENIDVDGFKTENQLESLFGRLSYSYADKYLVQFNVRRDGSSRFAKENRFGTFPSVSLGYRISKESFFNSSVINELKFRASYGVLGNQEVGDYSFIPVIIANQTGYTNYPFGLGSASGARQISFPSVGLKWEETKSTNIGFDMRFFNSKLIVEADYYVKDVEDILFQVPIPLSSGSAQSPAVNAASIRNKGFEIMAGWREYEGDFKYDFNVTFSSNDNKVNKLGFGDEAIVGGEVHWSMNDVTRTQVGGSLGEFYMYKSGGLFQTTAEIDQYRNSQGDLIMPDAQPGDVRIVDVNGDGQLNNEDKSFMGNSLPKAEIGFSFNSSYKQFDFNLSAYSALGAKKVNGGKWLSYRTDDSHGFHKDLLNAWTPQNTNTSVPRLVTSPSHWNVLEHDLWLEDASYFRLSHIEIGYSLSSSILKKVGLSSARIYAAGDNLFTITKYTGWDAGVIGGTGSSNGFDSGVDRNPYPSARQMVLGLQLSL
jgi:TonB-linked SusC/RagA family outer membrane protein